MKKWLGGRREVGVGHEGVVTMVKHSAGQVGNQRQSLGVQVAKHGIRFPAADQANCVAVDAAAEEGHCTTGTQTASIDIGRGETKGWQGANGISQCSGDMFGGKFGEAWTRPRRPGSKGRGRGSPMRTKVCDPASQCVDRTGRRVAAATMGNDLSTDTVLLLLEGDGHVCGPVKVAEWAVPVVKSDESNGEGEVL